MICATCRAIRSRLVIVGDQSGDLGEGRRRVLGARERGGRPDRLDDRPERDAVAVREAATSQDGRGIAELVHERPEQPRFPDTADAEHREELASPVGDGAVERRAEQGELAVAADHRRGQATSEPERRGIDLQEPIGLDPFAPTLQLEMIRLFDLHGVVHQPVRRCRDQDLIRVGALFEPCGNVHRITRGDLPPTDRIADDHLSGVHARPRAQPLRVREIRVVVQRIERLPDVDRGADGTKRVVFTQPWDPEDRDHGVADELLHRPAVSFDHAPRGVEVAPQQRLQSLRVEPLPELGRTHDVGEQDRDRPTGSRAELGRERCSTAVAEPRTLSDPVSAGGA